MISMAENGGTLAPDAYKGETLQELEGTVGSPPGKVNSPASFRRRVEQSRQHEQVGQRTNRPRSADALAWPAADDVDASSREQSAYVPLTHRPPPRVPISQGFEHVDVYEEHKGQPLGAANLAAADTVHQVPTHPPKTPSHAPPTAVSPPVPWQMREVLLSTLGAERLPQPGFEFILAGQPLLPTQEEEWPAAALRPRIVLRASNEPRNKTTPAVCRLEVRLAGEPIALGEIELARTAKVSEVRSEIIQRFGPLAPDQLALIDRRGRLIPHADEGAISATEIGLRAILCTPPEVPPPALSLPLSSQLPELVHPADEDEQLQPQGGERPPNSIDTDEAEQLQPQGAERPPNSIDAADAYGVAMEAPGSEQVREQKSEQERTLHDEEQQRLAVARQHYEKAKGLLDAKLKAEKHARLLDLQEQVSSGTVRGSRIFPGRGRSRFITRSGLALEVSGGPES